MGVRFGSILLKKSVQRRASPSDVPAVEVAGSHFELLFGASLSFLAQV